MRTRIIDVYKKDNFMVSVHTDARWVKLAWQAEPIFFHPDVTDGRPCRRRHLVNHLINYIINYIIII